MITVSQEQLETIEYLLNQSAQGHHVLFDLELVKKAFLTPLPPMSEEQAYEVEPHLEKVMSLEGIDQKKAYIEKLPEELLCRVVKTYFNIVENNLFESQAFRH